MLGIIKTLSRFLMKPLFSRHTIGSIPLGTPLGALFLATGSSRDRFLRLKSLDRSNSGNKLLVRVEVPVNNNC